MNNIRKLVLCVIALAFAMLSASGTRAQDISGDWQGTLHAQHDLRYIFHITKNNSGGWSAFFYTLDELRARLTVTPITLQDSKFKVSIPPRDVVYEGTVSADGNSISGTWTQSGKTTPFVLQRATKETAWPLPDPNFGHKLVAIDPRLFDKYAGQYQMASSSLVVCWIIYREGDHLYFGAPDGPRNELLPEGENKFFTQANPGEFIFNTDAQGHVTEMILRTNGYDTSAKRIGDPPPSK